MNYYETTSKAMRLIQNLHELNGDMEFIQMVGEGPLEGKDCDEAYATIHEQHEGWLEVCNSMFSLVAELMKKCAAHKEEEEVAIESLFSESEMRKKEIQKLKRNIELKNERIKNLKKDIEDRIERKKELKINSN
jgi:predicted RNase H-like nuclease (RuvC/YqgF family)